MTRRRRFAVGSVAGTAGQCVRRQDPVTTEAETLEEAARQLEQELGLATGFFSSLLKEDDWSFVVKLESLIESACTYLLVKATGQPSLEDIFAQLEIADKSTGKIAFIKALNLLEEKDRAFVHALAALRNILVHDVKNVASFSFLGYVEKLDKPQLTNLFKALVTSEFLKEYESSGKDIRKFLKESAKFLFWFGALELLGNVYIAKLREEIKQRSRQQLADYIDRFGGLRTEVFKELLKNAV